MIETVKSLIGRRTIQTAQLFIIMTDLEIVQQPIKRSECRHVIISAVETGFESLFSDEPLCHLLIVRETPHNTQVYGSEYKST